MADYTVEEIEALEAAEERLRRTGEALSEQHIQMRRELNETAKANASNSKDRLKQLEAEVEWLNKVQESTGKISKEVSDYIRIVEGARSAREGQLSRELQLTQAQINEQKRLFQEEMKKAKSDAEREEITGKYSKTLDDLLKKEKQHIVNLQEEKNANDVAGESFTSAMNALGIKTEKQKLTMIEALSVGQINLTELHQQVADFATSGVAATRIMASLGSKVIESTIAMMKQMDSLMADMYKLTGGSAELTEQFAELADKAGSSGVGFKTMGESITGLMKTSSNFTEMTNAQRESVARNNAQLIALGVSADTAGKNFSIFTQSLGMTVNQANASARQLVDLAGRLSMSASEITEGFGQAASTVAAYGKNAVTEFSKLAAESKALGLSVQELINIVKGADTFQGAAEQAGKLNAMLGGGLLNSSQLLVASESERIQLIRDAVMQTGRSFESMSKYEQIALANAAGIQDLTVAQKLFNQQMDGDELDRYLGKTNALGQSEEEMKAQALAAQSAQEKFAIVMEQFAASMEPVVWLLGQIMSVVMYLAPLIKTLATGFMILMAVKYAIIAPIQFVRTAMMFQALAASFAGKQADNLIVSLGKAAWAMLGQGAKAFAAAVHNFLFAGSMQAANVSGLRVVVTIGLIVGALYLLYQILHKSGSPMLYAIFGFMAIGIFFFGEALNKNKQGIMAFGAAMLMIGIGAFMAFHGLEGFATALSKLDMAQLAALVITIGLLALAMIVMFAIVISAGSAAVGPMLALGVAFLLIGAGAFLAGLGLSLVVNAFANLATNIVALLLLPLFLQLMAVGFIALTLSLYAFGTALPIILTAIPLLFGLGIVLGNIAAAMLVAAVSSVIFGAGLLIIGKAISNFTLDTATAIIAVAGALGVLQLTLIGIGLSMLTFSVPIMAAIGLITLMAAALSMIEPEKSIALKTTVDSIKELSETGTQITPETVKNLDNVIEQIHKLNIEANVSKAVNVVAPFKELINAINGQTEANAANGGATVIMKLNDREFGRAVIETMNKMGTANTVLRKSTPAGTNSV